jgi:multiple sugar transport system permease protein
VTALKADLSSSEVGVRQKSDTWLALVLISPILLTMVGLVFYPLLGTSWDSLHRVDPTQQGTPFVGLANYTRMFSDNEELLSWWHTCKYVVLALTDEIVLGLAAAAIINQVTVGRQWLLAATVLPYAVPAVVSSMIRRWIFAPSAGLLNGLLPLFGFDYDNHVWFNNGTVALLHVLLLHV